jgi:hypothetical protein
MKPNPKIKESEPVKEESEPMAIHTTTETEGDNMHRTRQDEKAQKPKPS